MLSLQHFATNPKQYVVINGKNNNFSGMFKLKAIKTYHLGFIVKALQKCCGRNNLQKFLKQTNQPKSPNQMFNCDFLNFVFKGHVLKSLFFFI